SDGAWHSLDVEVDGQHVVVDVDGVNYINASLNDSEFSSGMVGLTVYDGTVEFNELEVQEISEKTLAKGLLVPEGNVGIGTTSPAAKLDVAGKIKAQVFESGSYSVSSASANAWMTVLPSCGNCHGSWTISLRCSGDGNSYRTSIVQYVNSAYTGSYNETVTAAHYGNMPAFSYQVANNNTSTPELQVRVNTTNVSCSIKALKMM
ncbi:MAG: hypothetical protein WEB87_04955, partial [Bacteriovoracaceae bacterium]